MKNYYIFKYINQNVMCCDDVKPNGEVKQSESEFKKNENL